MVGANGRAGVRARGSPAAIIAAAVARTSYRDSVKRGRGDDRADGEHARADYTRARDKLDCSNPHGFPPN